MYIKKSLLAIVFFSDFAYSAQSATVNLSGTLVEPQECSFDSESYDVDFGSNIITTSVSNANLSASAYVNDANNKPIAYTMTCKGVQSANYKMKLVPSSVSSFSQNAVATTGTNPNNLGIFLMKDDLIYNIGTEFTFTSTKLPKLNAVLIKNNGVTLAPGAFTASVDMVITNP
ncbi:fimbrial protein [Klebsiella oxytoca]|uniref:fimbrial protein n=1 Tax=Klebsiella oxytoca TaxID=571 RepID=UPI002246DB6D|nr:fimbrial protein [Klebsiella oxytoca]MCW9445975.1 fimbrial protein [Klebsiella oxytoca]